MAKERIFSGYGLTKNQAERLIAMGPEVCDLFEDTVECAYRMGILEVCKKSL